MDNINNRQNEIFIKGYFDDKNGVEDLQVIRTEKLEPFGALDFKKEIIFKGDLKNIASSEEDIKKILSEKFSEDGFRIVFSIK